MTKIMLVEDDNNLREIYEARLLAEGYEIVSAKDGEEALAIAVKEKPDLIISDVMMPKISGFDMLDILRSTPETKDTKVIMMTALSQAEDKQRADRLGADRYLVKSQVTLEDVAKVAREVIDNQPAQASPTAAPEVAGATAPAPAVVPVVAAPEPAASPTSATTPVGEPIQPVVPAAAQPAPATATPIPVTVTDDSTQTPPTAAAATDIDQQIAQFQASQQTTPAPTTPPSPATAPAPDASTSSVPQAPVPKPDAGGKRILEPIHDINTAPVDLNALLAKEEGTAAPAPGVITPTQPPTA